MTPALRVELRVQALQLVGVIPAKKRPRVLADFDRQFQCMADLVRTRRSNVIDAAIEIIDLEFPRIPKTQRAHAAEQIRILFKGISRSRVVLSDSILETATLVREAAAMLERCPA